ncbi:hypothetical protein LCGC14_1898150 [marine sediment metagenome]|uniref:Uncharacterized protein n=1 Tax=marine sediment metagenome TaxID=412755 RepID=A0A0F9IB89_9ZZZZ
MKKIKVEIKGETALLMNSPASMIEEQTGMKKATHMKTRTRKDAEKEADKLAYRKSNGELYIPCEAVKGTLLGASSYKKIGKYTAKPIMAAGVQISPEKIGLGIKKYELDIRTVVIQRNRVVKIRPKIENWKASFEIEYDETLIGNPEMIKEILEEAGKRVGLLDFRPQKTGNFGKFKITKWIEGK